MPRNTGLRAGDRCRSGVHIVAGDNLLRVSERGTERIRCKACFQASAARRYEAANTRRAELMRSSVEYRKKRNEADRLRRARKRRERGVPERKVGCTPHGIPFKECVECNRSRRQRYAERLRKYGSVTTGTLVSEAPDAMATKYDDMPSNPMNLLAPSEQATPYYHALVAEYDSARGNCYEDTELIDRDEDNPATAEEVLDFCKDCPLVLACRQYGEQETPHKRAGVFFGGVLYNDRGRPVPLSVKEEA